MTKNKIYKVNGSVKEMTFTTALQMRSVKTTIVSEDVLEMIHELYKDEKHVVVTGVEL